VARARTGLWSKYREARAKLTELESLRDTLERSRPRARGKKAAKTRTLNKLKRQIPAAKGLLTKARKGIERTRTSRKASTASSYQKRSDAAKRGWAKRRADASTSAEWAVWQHLLPDGSLTTVALNKADSSLEGMYWNAHGEALAGTTSGSFAGSPYSTSSVDASTRSLPISTSSQRARIPLTLVQAFTSAVTSRLEAVHEIAGLLDSYQFRAVVKPRT
jgi:hypothetical protein